MSFFTALVILAWNQLSLEHKTLSFSARTGQEQAQLQSLRAARLPCKSRADRLHASGSGGFELLFHRSVKQSKDALQSVIDFSDSDRRSFRCRTTLAQTATIIISLVARLWHNGDPLIAKMAEHDLSALDGLLDELDIEEKGNEDPRAAKLIALFEKAKATYTAKIDYPTWFIASSSLNNSDACGSTSPFDVSTFKVPSQTSSWHSAKPTAQAQPRRNGPSATLHTGPL